MYNHDLWSFTNYKLVFIACLQFLNFAIEIKESGRISREKWKEFCTFYFHRLTQIPIFVCPLRYLQNSPGEQSASLLHLWQPPMTVLHCDETSSDSILELLLLLLSSSGLSQILQYQIFGRIDRFKKCAFLQPKNCITVTNFIPFATSPTALFSRQASRDAVWWPCGPFGPLHRNRNLRYQSCFGLKNS